MENRDTMPVMASTISWEFMVVPKLEKCIISIEVLGDNIEESDVKAFGQATHPQPAFSNTTG